jgi:predicted acylesterase/phospholipase RssA
VNGTATGSTWQSQPSRLGITVSGGAPTLHLAAGALCAFYEREVSFDIVATSGAGALPALLYMTPKKSDPVAALKGIVNLNIYDSLYRLIPSNFKVFFKYGPFSPVFWQLGRMIPRAKLDPDNRHANASGRLYNDLIDLFVAAITPTTLNYWSKSVLNRVEVINELIDWEALKRHPKDFYLNAFSFKTRKLELFDKMEMSPATFYAALAMPWLFPPTGVGGTDYTEGASHDPSGLETLKKEADLAKLDAIVVLETIGPELWTDPEDILEALELTILDPIVTLAENVAAFYSLQEIVLGQDNPPLPKVYRLQFDLSSWERGKTLEWSYSNALRLWDIGYQTAETFYKNSASATARGTFRPAETYRYLDTLAVRSRVDDFLGLFGAGLSNPEKNKVPHPQGRTAGGR